MKTKHPFDRLIKGIDCEINSEKYIDEKEPEQLRTKYKIIR
ncbi:MAG: hypothetical protein NTW49_14025 [Bacteroidia bacterium]|nr:hypothetical protein [Bacteroidia bacterium]